MPRPESPKTEPFSVNVQRQDGFSVVTATGELDVYTSTELRETLEGVVSDGAEHVVVDLIGVSFMDSSGLGLLVGTQKAIKELPHGSFAVVCDVSGPVQRLITLTGLVHVLGVYDSLAAAFLGPSGNVTAS